MKSEDNNKFKCCSVAIFRIVKRQQREMNKKTNFIILARHEYMNINPYY